MPDTPWDSKLKAFLKKTGDDFRRAGADIKQEAERLLAEAKDPVRAKKIKEGLTEVSSWAKKTAEELAGYVETGVKKAEGALKEVVAKPASSASPIATPSPTPVPPTPQTVETPQPRVARPAKKSVGRGSKKSTSANTTGPKKPLGRAKR